VLLAVLCALGAALLYAFASVFQQRGAAEQPGEESMRVGLLWRLVRNPTWLLGLVCDVSAYVLQFVALGHGPLVLVQPLLVCGLLFALPVGAAWSGRRMAALDWIGAVLVCAGLAVFLTVADPAPGRSNTGRLNWLLLLTTVAAVAGALTLGARGNDARRKALTLATGAGIVYGAAAALTKTSSHLLTHEVLRMFLHWQPYALIAFGMLGMLMAQSAFQADALHMSLPAMTVADPIVSIAIGATLFREAISTGPPAVAAEAVSLVAMTVGIVALSRKEPRRVAAPD
jgi:drug/metabolite transporter (DMT)-like permease